MAKAIFKVSCIATYDAEMEIPNEIAEDKSMVLEFIRMNFKTPDEQTELEYRDSLNGKDAVDWEDLDEIIP